MLPDGVRTVIRTTFKKDVSRAREVATPITLGGALALGMHQQEVLPDGREHSEWNDRDSERSVMRSLVRLNSRLVFFEDRRQAVANHCTNA